MFLISSVDIGVVRPGKKTEVSFPYEDIVITGLSSGCQCTAPLDYRSENRVVSQHTAPQFPVHLQHLQTIPISVPIEVSYYVTDPNDIQKAFLGKMSQ